MTAENENAQVETLLNSVSDEYLKKRKLKRIVCYSIILAVVLAIAITIITLSCIKVDLKPSFIDNASSYGITISNSEVMNIDKSNKEYNEFNEIYLKSFKSQYLTALFTGRLGGYDVQETFDPFYASTSSSSPSSKLKSQLGENYVRVLFSEPRQILNYDGSVYRSKANTNTTLTFSEMYFSLANSNAEQNLVFYFGVTGSYQTARILKITVRANTYELYKYVTK